MRSHFRQSDHVMWSERMPLAGRTVYVPVIPPSTSTTGKTAAHAEPSPEQDMRFLRLNSVADYRACLQRKDRWGIPSAGLRTLDTDEVRQDGEQIACLVTSWQEI